MQFIGGCRGRSKNQSFAARRTVVQKEKKTLSYSSWFVSSLTFFCLLCRSTTTTTLAEKRKHRKKTMWRDLPPDLANLVFEELSAPEDRAAFRTTCRYRGFDRHERERERAREREREEKRNCLEKQWRASPMLSRSFEMRPPRFCHQGAICSFLLWWIYRNMRTTRLRTTGGDENARKRAREHA